MHSVRQSAVPVNVSATHGTARLLVPNRFSSNGPMKKVAPTMVSYKPAHRPHCPPGAGSTAWASPTTLRSTEETLSSKASANHHSSRDVSSMPAADAVLKKDASCSACWRPTRLTNRSTSGVTGRMPIQLLTASATYTATDTPFSLNRSGNHGSSMNLASHCRKVGSTMLIRAMRVGFMAPWGRIWMRVSRGVIQILECKSTSFCALSAGNPRVSGSAGTPCL